MPESTVTVKVELSDESKRLIAEMVKPMYVVTCDPPVPITPTGIRYTFLDEEPTPARNEYMDAVIGQTIKFHNYAEEILRIAERCKTVAEFDDATDEITARNEDIVDALWDRVVELRYAEATNLM